MKDYIDRIIINGVEATVVDSRLPTPPAEGEFFVTIDGNGAFAYATGSGGAALESFLDGSLTSASVGAVSQIPAVALKNCSAITTLELGPINGPIGQEAFYGLTNVDRFSLDPNSVITSLGTNCFAGLGMDRNGTQRFVLDFRNSTFKGFCGFGTPTIPASYDSGGTPISPAIPGIGLVNAEVRLPETVAKLGYLAPGEEPQGSGSGYSSSGSGGILNSCEDVDVYFSGSLIPPLDAPDQMPTDEQSHVYVPFANLGPYKLSTNWAELPNLYGYAVYPDAENLPIMDTEGFSVAWYADKALTEPISVGNGQEIYADQLPERISSKVVLSAAYEGTVSITAGAHEYAPGELIPVGTEIVITAVHEGTGAGELTLFKVDGTDYKDAGSATVTIGTSNVNVSVAYDVPELPWYLRMVNYDREWDSSAPKDAIKEAYSGSIPVEAANLIVSPVYLVDGTVCFVKAVASDGFGYNYTTANLRTIKLPSTVVKIGSGAFYNYGNLMSIDMSESPIEQIGYSAFWSCSNLTNIEIPTTTKRIESHALENCSNLTYVSYGSTVEDWNEIQLDSAWKQNSPFSVVHCTDGDVIVDDPLVSINTTNATVTVTDTNGNTYSNGSRIAAGTVVTVTQQTTLPESSYPTLVSLLINGVDYASTGTATLEATASGVEVICAYEHAPGAIASFANSAFFTATYQQGGSTVTVADQDFVPSGTSVTVALALPQEATFNTATINGTSYVQSDFPVTVNVTDTLNIMVEAGCQAPSYLTFSIDASNNTCSITGSDSDTLPSSVTLYPFYLINGTAYSLTSIGSYAFHNRPSLTSITIPSSVTSISETSIYYCESLTSIVVDPSNPVYDSRDNCNAIIRTADNAIVIGCSATVIPSSITSIAGRAFASSSLASITIPSSVTLIDYAAFYHCYNLTSFSYSSSVSDWSFVFLGSNWKSGAPFTVVHCTDGDVQL